MLQTPDNTLVVPTEYEDVDQADEFKVYLNSLKHAFHSPVLTLQLYPSP
jgi:hypothetical protein